MPCQDQPGWSDRFGDTCDYYKMYPHACNFSDQYKKLGKDGANEACCGCREKITVTPAPTSGGTVATFNPCPDSQVWGDFGDAAHYIETGTATCPPGVICYNTDYSWMYGQQGNFEPGMGQEEGCWKQVSGTLHPQFTCGDDDYCKNLDLYNSSRGNLVYRCPNATCEMGNCNCGPDCVKDSRTQICVRETDIVTDIPSPPPSFRPPTTKIPDTAGPIPMPTQEPINVPVPTPPVNECVTAKVGEDSYVCWKRLKEYSPVRERYEEYIVDCDPSFCGLKSMSKAGNVNVGGNDVTVYKQPTSPPTSHPPTSRPTNNPTNSPTNPPSSFEEEVKELWNEYMGVWITLIVLGSLFLLFLFIYLLGAEAGKGKRKGRKGKKRKMRMSFG